jgi:hypothetical protein
VSSFVVTSADQRLFAAMGVPSERLSRTVGQRPDHRLADADTAIIRRDLAM